MIPIALASRSFELSDPKRLTGSCPSMWVEFTFPWVATERAATGSLYPEAFHNRFPVLLGCVRGRQFQGSPQSVGFVDGHSDKGKKVFRY